MTLENLFNKYIGKDFGKPISSYSELAMLSNVSRPMLTKIRNCDKKKEYCPTPEQLRNIIRAICQNIKNDEEANSVLVEFSKIFNLKNGKYLPSRESKKLSNSVKRKMGFITPAILPQKFYAELKEVDGNKIPGGFLYDLLQQIADYGNFGIIRNEIEIVGKSESQNKSKITKLDGYQKTLLALNSNNKGLPDFIVGRYALLRSRKGMLSFSLPILGIRFPIKMLYIDYQSNSSDSIHFCDFEKRQVLNQVIPIGCVKSEVGHEFIKINMPWRLVNEDKLGSDILRIEDAYDAASFVELLKKGKIRSVIADGSLIDEITKLLKEDEMGDYIRNIHNSYNSLDSHIPADHLARYPVSYAMAHDESFANLFNQTMLDFYLECTEAMAILYNKYFDAIFPYRAMAGDIELKKDLHRLEKNTLSMLDFINSRRNPT